MGSTGPHETIRPPNDGPSVSRSAVSKRVLIVECDADGAESMAFLLTHHGHQVRIARAPREAFQEVARFRPQVVLLEADLRAPQTGYDVARRLRQILDPPPRLVVITGVDESEERSRSEGIEHHFVKPAEIRPILELIASA